MIKIKFYQLFNNKFKANSKVKIKLFQLKFNSKVKIKLFQFNFHPLNFDRPTMSQRDLNTNIRCFSRSLFDLQFLNLCNLLFLLSNNLPNLPNPCKTLRWYNINNSMVNFNLLLTRDLYKNGYCQQSKLKFDQFSPKCLNNEQVRQIG